MLLPGIRFSPVRSALPMIGATLGRYRIVDTLGAGGMGVVYRAEDTALHRAVALKFLPPEIAADEEMRARFLREARVAAALNHPNTCTVYEVGEVGGGVAIAGGETLASGTPFIAMEYIEGETLAARLARSPRLSLSETLDVAIQVAEGLAEAHAHQIVHRDLKPHNVMITGRGRVKILDFGLAKPLKPRRPGVQLTTSDAISADLGHVSLAGTSAYMSPEQALGTPVDHRSDLFAFGIMLYEMIAGHRPFRAENPTAVLAKIIEAEPEPLQPGAAPAALQRVVRRCLEKMPDRRYADTRDLLAELGEIRRVVTSGMAPPATRLVSAKVWSWWQSAADAHAASGRRRVMTPILVLLLAVPLIYLVSRRAAEAPVEPAHRVVSSADIQRASDPVARPEIGASEVHPSIATNSEPTAAPTATPAVETPQANVPPRQSGGEPPSRAQDAVALPPPPPPRTAGRLTISSDPPSTVSLNGRLAGITPLSVDVVPGSYEVSLTRPDGLGWRGRIDLVAGGASTIHRDLNAVGSLSVVSEVWAEVSLDGGPPEQTPIHFSRVAAGLHQLRVSRDGYIPQHLEVIVEEGQTTHVRLALEKRP